MSFFGTFVLPFSCFTVVYLYVYIRFVPRGVGLAHFVNRDRNLELPLNVITFSLKNRQKNIQRQDETQREEKLGEMFNQIFTKQKNLTTIVG